MNAVGIDVSKGKSVVVVVRPGGEVVISSHEVSHTPEELHNLACLLKSLNGETRIVMEYTGKYYEPIARHLHDAGLFVSVVHAMLIHRYDRNSLRRVKTDKADAVKIACYGLDRWSELRQYSPPDDTRSLLKACCRQYNHYMRLKIMLKNNLITLLDQVFPGTNTLFSSKPRKDGHEKWIDFAGNFWHRECVSGLTEKAFISRYAKWCKRAGYRHSDDKARSIYMASHSRIATLPKNETTKAIVSLAIAQINTINETLAATQREMHRLSSLLPEYHIVMAMRGVGETLGPQLMAEIGDVARFERKQSLIAFAGLDVPPFQSGTFEAKNRRMSKRGSPILRKILFQVMDVVLKTTPYDDPIYQYLDKKRAEGKHYYVYMMAGANKFLRIYFARVREHLDVTAA